jgi:hypothetical protein
MTDLLSSVDWNAWKRAGGTSVDGEAATVVRTAAGVRQASETERVALLVLALGRPRDVKSPEAARAIRTALRDIEQSVLSAEQEIDWL